MTAPIAPTNPLLDIAKQTQGNENPLLRIARGETVAPVEIPEASPETAGALAAERAQEFEPSGIEVGMSKAFGKAGELGFVVFDAVGRIALEQIEQVGEVTKQMLQDFGGPGFGGAPGIDQYVTRTPEEEEKAMQGAALLASFAPGLLATRIPVANKLVGKAGMFLIGEALGGGIYGAARPLEEGETREDAITTDAAMFGLGGAVFGLAPAASVWLYNSTAKRYLLKQTAAKQARMAEQYALDMERIDASLRAEGGSVDALPSQARAEIENQVLNDVFEVHDPAAVLEIEDVMIRESQLKVEPKPRMQAFVKNLEPPHEVDLPDEVFEAVVQKAKPKKPTGKATMPSVAAAQEAKKAAAQQEQITGVAFKDQTGEVHVGDPGTIHPDIRERVSQVNPERQPLTKGEDGFVTNKGRFVGREEAATIKGFTGKSPGRRLDSKDLLPSNLTDPQNIIGSRHGPPPPAAMTAAEIAKSVLDIGGPAPGATERTAIVNAGIDDAVSKISMLDVATPEIRAEATLMKQLMSENPPAAAVDALMALEKSLMQEGSAAEKYLHLTLEHPQPSKRGAKRALGESLERAPQAHIGPIEPLEQITAPWASQEQLLAPPLDGLAMTARFDDQALETLMNTTRRMMNERGATRLGVMARILTGTAGGVLEWAAYDDDLPPDQKSTMHMVGRMLLAITALPALKIGAQKFGKALIQQANPIWLMSRSANNVLRTKGAEFARQALENMTTARAFTHEMSQTIHHEFTTEPARRNLMYVLDEGMAAPEWHMLTPRQQQIAMSLHQFNMQMARMMQGVGALDGYIDRFAREILPEVSYQKWAASGHRVSPPGIQTANPRKILRVRDLEAWTARNGVPGPILDPAFIQQQGTLEAFRSVGTARMRSALESAGLIQPAVLDPPAGWSKVKGSKDKIAPDEVVAALDNMTGAREGSAWLRGLDTAKSWWMRSIMLWFWEHGLNAWRAIPGVALNPIGYYRAQQAITRNDPVVMEAARHGVDLFSRPDYGPRSAHAFQAMLRRAGFAAPLLRGADRFLKWQDKILWDNMVPALQLFAWNNEMLLWSQRTKGKFLPGSAEYVAQARKAADYANNVAGRIPQELVNPKLAQGLRLLLFSPQWTTSRMALTGHAMGELDNMLNVNSFAELKGAIQNNMYLPFKMRQLAAGIAVTYVLSKALTGKDPDFNPNTLKFYAHTGWKGPSGREMGLDVLGWYQQDLQQFNDPLAFLLNRLNPSFKVIKETVEGRDYSGRDMTGMQRLENLFESFGPPAEATAVAIRLGQGMVPGGAPPMSPGEILSRSSGVTATFNVATFPRHIDAALSKVAKRLLKQQHLPANDDAVYELSKLMRSNLMRGQALVNDQIVKYLAYQRRSHSVREPVGYGIDYLWREARGVLRDF